MMNTSLSTPTRWQLKLYSKHSARRIGILLGLLLLSTVLSWFIMILMPGRSYRGPLPPLTERESALALQIRRDVEMLATEIGDRSLFHQRKMGLAYEFLSTRFRTMGFEEIEEVPVSFGAPVPNLAVTVRGTSLPSEIIVIGAHYDTCQGTPGADDNASGVAGVLALAEYFIQHPQPRTLRFALFVNEEPPTFQTPDMGAWVYAKVCKERNDNIVAMLSLESIGYYSTAKGSQHYPSVVSLCYPDTGDFIAFIGNLGSRKLVRQCVRSFRTHVQFPSEGAALPASLEGVGWSDHWGFWQEGYPAIMVTGTAPFRNPHYHKPTDTADKLDYERTARVVVGLEKVITDLADRP